MTNITMMPLGRWLSANMDLIRDLDALSHVLSTITSGYIMNELDRYDSEEAIGRMFLWDFIGEKIINDLDDPGGSQIMSSKFLLVDNGVLQTLWEVGGIDALEHLFDRGLQVVIPRDVIEEI
ncbi:MAG: hypothetical protein R3D02_10110 [Hyphomicrobiales bacterium]